MVLYNSMTDSADKLNLGCGTFKKPGYINVDIYPEFEPDVLHDLNKLPYPFPDNRFELIEIFHVLEHLDEPLRVIRELRRISKHNGLIVIKVPHFSRGFSHPEHKRGFDVSLPYYFSPSFGARYTSDITLELCTMRLNWFAQPELKKGVLPAPLYYAARAAGAIINFFANLSPLFCSRVWCFWVGGFDEIEFIFKVKK